MKLPSLRQLAKENGISVTTVETAYNQLLVEGYIESRPKSNTMSAMIYLVRSEMEVQAEELTLDGAAARSTKTVGALAHLRRVSSSRVEEV